MKIDILLVDDHKILREGLKQLLEMNNEFNVVGQAKDGEEAISLNNKLKPNVVLLDINLPKINGLEVLSLIKKKNTKTKVIILTIHNETEFIVKAMDLKCDAYILKDSGYETIKEAIYETVKDEIYIQPSLVPKLNSLLTNREEVKITDILSDREIEVLKLVAHGMLNREIAESLDIKERTVKNHLTNIFKKLNVDDRTKAAVYAIKHSLIDL